MKKLAQSFLHERLRIFKKLHLVIQWIAVGNPIFKPWLRKRVEMKIRRLMLVLALSTRFGSN